jgi:hypothetical protein
MNQQVNQDFEHLKILSILFYVLAGLCLLPGLFGLFYMVMGIFFGAAMMSSDISHQPGAPPPALFGGIFVFVGAIILLFSLAFAILAFKAGRNLSKKQGYTFCFVVACIVCLWMPLGTILGIFTIIVLMRDSVKAIFNGGGQNFSQFNNHTNWQ